MLAKSGDVAPASPESSTIVDDVELDLALVGNESSTTRRQYFRLILPS
jgi:hypothetical protein